MVLTSGWGLYSSVGDTQSCLGPAYKVAMGKSIIVVGLLIAGIGVLMSIGVPMGRLPGDMVFRRGNATVYIPITTSVVVSVVITLAMVLFRR